MPAGRINNGEPVDPDSPLELVSFPGRRLPDPDLRIRLSYSAAIGAAEVEASVAGTMFT